MNACILSFVNFRLDQRTNLLEAACFPSLCLWAVLGETASSQFVWNSSSSIISLSLSHRMLQIWSPFQACSLAVQMSPQPQHPWEGPWSEMSPKKKKKVRDPLSICYFQAYAEQVSEQLKLLLVIQRAESFIFLCWVEPDTPTVRG